MTPTVPRLRLPNTRCRCGRRARLLTSGVDCGVSTDKLPEPHRPESRAALGPPWRSNPTCIGEMGPPLGSPVVRDCICQIAMLSEGRWRMTRDQAYTLRGLDVPCSSWRY